MKQNARWVSTLLTTLCALLAWGQTPLAPRLNTLLNAPLLRNSEVGITVYDLTADSSLFAYQSEKLYRPASVAKVLTSVTALSELGTDHLFTTRLYHDGLVSDSVLQGNLYVQGGFDPEFDDADMERLVEKVCRLGLRRIQGNIVGDVSMTDSLYYGAGWSWDDAPYDFQPCLSPLLYCRGCVKVTVTPRPNDTIPAVSVWPASGYYHIDNQARCRRPSLGPLRVSRNWMQQGNTLLITGDSNAPVTKSLTLHHSANYFLHTFTERLRRRGIEVAGYRYGTLPPEGTVALGFTTHSLTQVLQRALKKSDNLSAEALLRHLALLNGKSQGVSAADGIAVIERLISRIGLRPQDYSLVDGSGVSLYNYVSPELLLSFLKYAHAHPEIYRPLREALPIAGIDGTLAHRMQGKGVRGKVRAKTGTVTGVSSLVGYAEAANGHLLAFVIINQNVLRVKEARNFQDSVCAELCK
jgi:D-alanyl-D-alanine carboxypeptidase/D-alanyl-D-alanine-endopeptidase (penicillin-binding protein 4)